MGSEVAVVIKVLPDEPGVDLDKIAEDIKKALPPEYKLMRYEKEPIAFGLEALKLLIFMPEDFEGGTSQLENIIKKVNRVSEVEILMVTRMTL
ncbi:MAG: elongation factor 1-beta [Thermoprotei archaeon]|nr:MAG: elongation factor 1-beta [Thermoprotei archaeon]